MSATPSERRPRYPLAAVALVLAAFLLRFAIESAIDSYVETGSTWLLTFGTVGETATGYLLAANLLATVGVPAGAFYLGYRYGMTA
ncbi:hypothetical protein [Halobaculum sp. EA56]|uniref:hypothetical protein n=1 Tax=Halobaculum sp. EA56 TaxID=3421648 RepID=UPI003EB98E6C